MEGVTMTGSYASSRTRSAPAATSSESAPTSEGIETETWADRLFAAIPLFVVGAACLAIAIDLYFTADLTFLGQKGSARLQPWTLFLALAVTGLAAGTFALLFPEEEPPSPAPEPSTAPATPESSPAWDESTLETEGEPLLPKRSWELDFFTAQESPGPPPSDDAVLHQLDEIEASLRKKTRPPS